jgi:signal transduction histidine kinase
MPLSPALDTAQPPAVAAPARPLWRAGSVMGGAASLFAKPTAPLVTAAGVTVLVILCIAFARSSGLVAALWGAGGLAVAVWLRSGRGPAYDVCFGSLVAIGILAGEFLVGNTPLHSALFTLANMLEIVVAVVLARRFAPTLNLASVQGACRFLLSAAVLAPIPAAALAALMLNMTTGADPLESFQTWWFGHALGIAVIGSFGLALTKRHLLVLRNPFRMGEAVLLAALLAVVGFIVFCRMDVQVGFVVIPLLILVAARFRVLGVTTGLLIITVLGVGGAMSGAGPFVSSGEDLAGRALLAQLMVLLGFLPILLLASLLEERDRYAERSLAGQLRAERASAAKSRLLANVAHEIKSPVGGVIGIGELWSTGQLGPVTPTQVEMAEVLVKTARQVESLAHDLLDVARAESGAVKVELRPTDVPGVLEDVRRTIALRPDAQGLRLDVLCEGDGLIALADSQRLSQVIANLATNAVKYGGAGGVVQFRARRIYDGVRIEVADQGPGLSVEKQAQLFEPFNRLGLERSAVEGHGIGLALAKRLTELQGGSIGVESEPGQGAVFWVELPVA